MNHDKKRIGWIGTGIMGGGMCANLLKAGFPITVYNRTRSKAQPLLQQGAVWADSPFEVARNADVVFLMVGYPEDVRQVVLGHLDEVGKKIYGVIDGLKEGGILVDMTTSRPELAVVIAEECEVRKIHALDAPVTGGDVGAKNGTLSIMIGGDPAVAESLQDCFAAMGKTVAYQGGPGAGQHAKMSNQILIAANMCGVCESLLYAYRAGLDLEKVSRSLAQGAGGSWAYSNMGSRIIAGDFEPGFYVEHLLKDMSIILDEARRMQLALPGVALVNQLYLALSAQGHSRSGTQSLVLALAQINNIEWETKRN